MHLSADLARAVDEEAGRYPFIELARAAASISQRYRSDRPVTGHLSPVECAAWAAVRMPAAFSATHAVLEELSARDPQFRPQSVLDLGAGPGGGIHAACSVFPSIQRATAIEREETFIGLGEMLSAASGVARGRSLKWVRGDIRGGASFRPHDLVLVAWVAGELDHADRETVLARAWEAAGFVLVVLEPGTPRGFSTIKAAREGLMKLGASLAAPCPSTGPCGAAAGEWCHFSTRVERSALHRRLKSGELGYEDEKFCYLIATRHALAPVKARIVRHPVHEPGLVRLQLCTGDKWRMIEVRKYQREQFRMARKARWGSQWNLL